MGYFDVTLVLLKTKKDPGSFLAEFHKELRIINVTLEKDENDIIFNDSITDEEKEPFELNESMTDDEVLDLLCSWKGLGLLSYRHPDLSLPFSINYLTWDDKNIDGFDIGLYGKEFRNEEDEERHKTFVTKIGSLVDFETIIGDIGNTSEKYINLRQDLSQVKEIIKHNTFDIDIRQ
jgi:hypothetical protein